MVARKLPPFGKALAAMHSAENPPEIVIICAGQNCFGRARDWQKNPQVWALVMPDGEQPSKFLWQVSGIYCLIDWDRGPNAEQVMNLVKVLLKSGAANVTVRPKWIDVKQPAIIGDIDQPIAQWKQVRERIVTYPALGGEYVSA